MKKLMKKLKSLTSSGGPTRPDAGQVTAEYAVGSVAAVTIGLAVIGVIRWGPDGLPRWFLDFVSRLVAWICHLVGIPLP